MTDEGQTVVCGIDDSVDARAALAEALRLAARHGSLVRAVLVYEPPETWNAWGYGPEAGIPLPRLEAYQQSQRQTALGIVEPVLDELRGQAVTLPDVVVEAIPGRPVEALVEAAEGAESLVVGHRGLGAVGSVMMGSTSLGCVLHASCPVTVVPVPA